MERLYDRLREKPDLYWAFRDTEHRVRMILQTEKEAPLENHGISHIERVLEYVEQIYNSYFRQHMSLNVYECYVLLSAIYIHDMGFFLHNKEAVTDFCKWRKMETVEVNEDEFYRKYHPWIAAYWVKKNIDGDLSWPLIFEGDWVIGSSIIEVVVSHGIDFWKFPEYQKQCDGSDMNIRIGYLSYLLCLGDALDCDRRRNQDTIVGSMLTGSVEKRIFFRFHEYVNLITFDENMITIYMSIPVVAEEKKKIFTTFYLKKQMKWMECLMEVGNRLFPDTGHVLTLRLCVSECADQAEPAEEEYSHIEKYLI